MTRHTVTWQRLDLPGTETATLQRVQAGWFLDGSVSVEEDGHDWRFDYHVACDDDWRTVGVTVQRIRDEERQAPFDAWVTLGSPATWHLSGHERADLAGLVDIDLGFTPATNLLPIRRLDLDVDEEAEVTAAWLDFPSFTVAPLAQSYRRIAERAYRYRVPALDFETILEVDEIGFVIYYPGLWRAIPGGHRDR
jgi:uncharacterized protein